jgi:hypothetical protein
MTIALGEQPPFDERDAKDVEVLRRHGAPAAENAVVATTSGHFDLQVRIALER